MGTDYILEVRVKNGPLQRTMRRRGMNASVLARASNVSATIIGLYLNLKRVPINITGNWRPCVIRMAEALGVSDVAGLFPPQHLRAPLKRNTAELEVSLSDLSEVLVEHRTPEDAMFDVERKELLLARIESVLTPREADVIKRRFGIDGPEELGREIAVDYNVTRSRIFQLERVALRKLKNSNAPGAFKLRVGPI